METHPRFLSFLLVLALISVMVACGSTETQVQTVEVEKVVEKEVVKEVPVERVVEKEVVKEVPVQKVVVQEVPVPVALGTMRIGNSGNIGFLDSAKTQGGMDLPHSEMLYSRLLVYDPTMMDSQPDLAASWSVNDAGTDYTFKMRDGVQFHNGNPVTAEDIVFTWQRCRDEIADKGRCKGELTDVVSYSAPSASEFTVSIKSLSPVFLPSMAHWSMGTLDKNSVDTVDTNPIGTGSFTFVEHIPADRLVLDKNRDYHFQPHLGVRPDKVLIVPILEIATRVAALKAGEVDLILFVPYQFLDEIAATSGLHLIEQRGGLTAAYDVIAFEVREGPMKDVRLRQAVQLAIDKEAIHQASYFGYGEVDCNLIPSIHWAYEPIECPARDVEAAKKLVAEAGYPNGVTLNDVFGTGEAEVGTHEMVKQQLAEANINLKLHPVEGSVWVDRIWFGVDAPGKNLPGGVHKDFDMSIWGYSREPDPDGLMQSVLRATDAMSGFKGNNAMRYYNPVVEDLFDKGKSTLDWEERKKFYTEIVKIVVEDVPIIKLQTKPLFSAANDHIRDAYISPKGYFNYNDYIWLP